MAEAPAPQAAPEEALVEQDEMPAKFAAAVAKELPLSFEYQIPFPVDIESRDQVTILPLLTKKISAQAFHYSVPAKNSLTTNVSSVVVSKFSKIYPPLNKNKRLVMLQKKRLK